MVFNEVSIEAVIQNSLAAGAGDPGIGIRNWGAIVCLGSAEHNPQNQNTSAVDVDIHRTPANAEMDDADHWQAWPRGWPDSHHHPSLIQNSSEIPILQRQQAL